jgi:hypothetical protein
VLHGYDPVIGATPMLPITEKKYVQEMLTKRRVHMELIKNHLEVAQYRMKHQADKHRTDKEF